MPAMTNETWDNMPSEMKSKIINSIDQTLHVGQKFTTKLYKEFGDKPKLLQLSSGYWILKNTCVNWGLRFDFEIARHWCNLENYKNGHFVIWAE